VPWDSGGFSAFDHTGGPWIVVPGGTQGGTRRRGRLLLLPFHADIYHPDLVSASDAVVSKLGYSTVAEAYCAASALAYVERARFPESPVLARWVEANMLAARVEEDALKSTAWLDSIDRLLTTPPKSPDRPNGSAAAAEIIVERFQSVLN
jgi:UDP-N-acetylglucosamine:LPS N-acetylglucosamine transferase